MRSKPPAQQDLLSQTLKHSYTIDRARIRRHQYRQGLWRDEASKSAKSLACHGLFTSSKLVHVAMSFSTFVNLWWLVSPVAGAALDGQHVFDIPSLGLFEVVAHLQ